MGPENTFSFTSRTEEEAVTEVGGDRRFVDVWLCTAASWRELSVLATLLLAASRLRDKSTLCGLSPLEASGWQEALVFVWMRLYLGLGGEPAPDLFWPLPTAPLFLFFLLSPRPSAP